MTTIFYVNGIDMILNLELQDVIHGVMCTALICYYMLLSCQMNMLIILIMQMYYFCLLLHMKIYGHKISPFHRKLSKYVASLILITCT